MTLQGEENRVELKKMAVSGTMLTLLLASMTALALNILLAKASGTIYIRADGSIDPPTTLISSTDNVTYFFTGDISGEIVIERSNIIVSGNGFTLKGYEGYSKSGKGLYLPAITNVTVTNTTIQAFEYAIYLDSASHNVVSGNRIGSANYLSANEWGINLVGSSSNKITGNNISSQYQPGSFSSECGIRLSGNSNNNAISENKITDTGNYGIQLLESLNNTVSHNMISYPFDGGIEIESSSTDNKILENNLTLCGIRILGSFGNSISRNNLVSGSIYLSGSSSNNISRNNMTSGGISLAGSSHNMVSENNVANGNRGVYLSDGSSGNIVSRNNIAHNDYGITVYICHNNTFAQNNITNNQEIGVSFYHCMNSTLLGNTIANNSGTGLDIVGHTDEHSSTYIGNNVFYHNNFINNTPQVYVFYSSGNTWDNGYPSGGNFWSDYTGTDADVDGIGDTPYTIVDHSTSANYQDRYPLMSQWVQREHELATSLTAQGTITLGDSTSLKATVTNEGLKDEVNVELSLLINDAIAESESIPSLPSGHSYSLSYLWTPTAEGTFNVTAYAHPVSEETSLKDNQVTKFVTVAVSPVPPEVQAGVKAGDWIKIEYTISGASSGSPLPQWLKMEFLSVQGTTATVRVTMHMSDGTEQSETPSVDVVASGQALGLSGFLIPANCATGDCIYMTGYGNLTIEGETTRTYAGASRTVVYASFSQLGSQLTYYWDKQTGVMVEASTISGSITGTGKATETNIWQADSSPFWLQWWFYALVAAIIVALAVAVYFAKKRKLPASTAPSLSAEGT